MIFGIEIGCLIGLCAGFIIGARSMASYLKERKYGPMLDRQAIALKLRAEEMRRMLD